MLKSELNLKSKFLIVEKDRHITQQEPFFSAHRDYVEWLLSSKFNSPEYSFFSLGDFFSSSRPTPSEMALAVEFVTRSKFEKIFILKGNHCYNRLLKSISIKPLSKLDRVEIIEEPTQLVLNGIKMLCLPFIYQSVDRSMEKEYGGLEEPFIENDFIFHHFEDETISFGASGKTGIDVSYLKGKRVGGHVHLENAHYPLGMPVTSRYDERTTKNNLGVISFSDKSFTVENVPAFMGYATVKYPDPLPSVESKHTLWDIEEVVGKTSWKDLYGPLFVHNVKKKVVETFSGPEDSSEKDTSVLGLLKKFLAERSHGLDPERVVRFEKTIASHTTNYHH